MLHEAMAILLVANFNHVTIAVNPVVQLSMASSIAMYQHLTKELRIHPTHTKVNQRQTRSYIGYCK